MIFGKGISKSGEIVDMGIELGIVEKSGSWFYYNGERIAQGKDNARKYFEENPAVLDEVEAKIKELKAKGAGEESSDTSDDVPEDLDIRLLDLDIDE